MSTNYVLVDFENVQPDLSLLADTPFKVKVFFGAKQQEGRVPFKLLDAMLALGGNVEPVKVMRSGSNAVDMHIAYYIGRLIEREPDATLHIISGDTDFDPLAEYLRANGVSCHRSRTIAELTKKAAPPRQQAARSRPAPAKTAKGATHSRSAAPAKKPTSDKLATIIRHLHALSGKPATRKKLAQTIATFLKQHGGEQPADVVEQLIDELIRLKYVGQAGTKVSYYLS
jgi:hypothetical protein